MSVDKESVLQERLHINQASKGRFKVRITMTEKENVFAVFGVPAQMSQEEFVNFSAFIANIAADYQDE